jgi:Family of unknown function (DUF5329)
MLLLALAVFSPAAVAAPRAGLPAAEKQKIEALIASVQKLDGAVFVRNGKSYKPATAAKFLRGKWDDRAEDVGSAEQFIDKIATRSSTTGKPYLVRFIDGREIPTATFLRAQLGKLR